MKLWREWRKYNYISIRRCKSGAAEIANNKGKEKSLELLEQLTSLNKGMVVTAPNITLETQTFCDKQNDSKGGSPE